MDYDLQSDDLDEPDEYYLLAKRHTEADKQRASLFSNGRLVSVIKKEINPSVTEEQDRNFTPKFQPVPTPVNADEERYKMFARLQRLEERALHGN